MWGQIGRVDARVATRARVRGGRRRAISRPCVSRNSNARRARSRVVGSSRLCRDHRRCEKRQKKPNETTGASASASPAATMDMDIDGRVLSKDCRARLPFRAIVLGGGPVHVSGVSASVIDGQHRGGAGKDARQSGASSKRGTFSGARGQAAIAAAEGALDDLLPVLRQTLIDRSKGKAGGDGGGGGGKKGGGGGRLQLVPACLTSPWRRWSTYWSFRTRLAYPPAGSA